MKTLSEGNCSYLFMTIEPNETKKEASPAIPANNIEDVKEESQSQNIAYKCNQEESQTIQT